jgi:hypothetical protein
MLRGIENGRCLPRSDVGNQVAVRRALPGNAGASAVPTMKRIKKSVTSAMPTGKAATKPCTKVRRDQKKMLNA